MLKRIFFGIFLVALLFTALPIAECAKEPIISVTGVGKIEAKPNVASVVLSVKNTAHDAKSAQEANAKAAERVVNRLHALKIAADDIKTARYNIYPVYDNSGKTRRITGYSAENSITVKIRDVEKVGKIIDESLAAGANQVSSVEFGVSDASAYEKEALVLAVKNAREQAQIVANALNVKIIGVKKASPAVERRSFDAASRMMKATAANANTPIESGVIAVTATISVEFIVQ